MASKCCRTWRGCAGARGPNSCQNLGGFGRSRGCDNFESPKAPFMRAGLSASRTVMSTAGCATIATALSSAANAVNETPWNQIAKSCGVSRSVLRSWWSRLAASSWLVDRISKCTVLEALHAGAQSNVRLLQTLKFSMSDQP